uniref:Uncharacterized protein n=1 Tax=Solanum lycopersicum TaxID=4081 RepID=A0A3Q7GQR5_SOLLC
MFGQHQDQAADIFREENAARTAPLKFLRSASSEHRSVFPRSEFVGVIVPYRTDGDKQRFSLCCHD